MGGPTATAKHFFREREQKWWNLFCPFKTKKQSFFCWKFCRMSSFKI